MRDPRSSFIAWLFVSCLVAVFWSSGARAQSVALLAPLTQVNGLAVAYAPGTITLTNGSSTAFGRAMQTFSAATDADFTRLLTRGYTPPDMAPLNAVKATDAYAIMVDGVEIIVGASRIATAAAIAEGAVAVGAAAWAGAQAAAPISKAFGHDTLDIGQTRCTATYTGWACDPMAAPITGGTTRMLCDNLRPDVCALSAVALGNLIINSYELTGKPNCNAAGFTCTLKTPVALVTATSWTAVTHVVNANCNCYPYGENDRTVNGSGEWKDVPQAESCPATIDALNPAWSRAEGSPPVPDPDGGTSKCPTGRYNNPGDSVVTRRLADNLRRIAPEIGIGLLRDVLTGGGTVPTIAPRDLTGPSSVPGPATTVVTTPAPTSADPSPTPVSTTTGSDRPLTYGPGPAINVGPPTTTTSGPSGTTTTTTTGTGRAVSEQSDLCLSHPEIVACQNLGDPPSQNPVWGHRDIPYAAEDLGFSGACPAPFVIPFYHGANNVTFTFQPLCDLAPIFKAFLIALVTVSCGVLIVQQTTKTT